MAVVFDTLAYARRLKKVGVSEEQAEVQAEALAAVVNDQLVTKEDLRVVATRQELSDLRQEFKELKQELRQDLRELEHRLTVRLGTMMTVAVGALAALVKLL
jgi:hypothetical protein